MSPAEYQALAFATAKDLGSLQLNLMHAGLGLAGEAGETADLIKKHTCFGKPLETEKLNKELGDILWYVALSCELLGLSMERVMQDNIAKLRQRHVSGTYSDSAQIAQADKQVAV